MGLPIVTLPGEFMRGRQTMGMLAMLGVEELIVATIDEYLTLARLTAQGRVSAAIPSPPQLAAQSASCQCRKHG